MDDPVIHPFIKTKKSPKIGSVTPIATSRDLLSIADLSRDEIQEILFLAKTALPADLLRGKVLASCFFEPSTRTRLSFESAMLRLGGSVLGFSDMATTSAKKGESLSDCMRMIEAYADIAVLRHPHEGAARLSADVVNIPIINGGDGANQHPTQTLVDLFSIQECQGRLDALEMALVGDLRFGRTVHSLALALAHFSTRLYFVSPEELSLPTSIIHELRKKGVKFSFHSHLEEILPKLDVLYLTRIQKERFLDLGQVHPILLRPEWLEQAKPNLRILHPLPRQEELDPRIDATPFAYYFTQAKHGVEVRKTILGLLLGAI